MFALLALTGTGVGLARLSPLDEPSTVAAADVCAGFALTGRHPSELVERLRDLTGLRRDNFYTTPRLRSS